VRVDHEAPLVLVYRSVSAWRSALGSVAMTPIVIVVARLAMETSGPCAAPQTAGRNSRSNHSAHATDDVTALSLRLPLRVVSRPAKNLPANAARRQLQSPRLMGNLLFLLPAAGTSEASRGLPRVSFSLLF
jgi:hypothetical protein